ncbi:MAG: T9SS type A sorting domain-containing protein [Melioribacteraceae bacterium]|nr:T9SS type A sorting domain-containing protein [Melioribacteraceae bacterium]MCF8355260.1 T9SS type A sorting domain-containing protein [Melioribacteraceae bacterium]MCF8394159.1 T9SS type A sorting domain-containing protein [Melioribacteraceae bacterium]MCF8418842.1 T9SS type A sorting domain-containing protein [Melioribacteraceae bacterium]
MKKINLISAALFLFPAFVFAQSFIGKLNPHPAAANSASANDTLKILAVMVEFQEDLFDATFGNGKFGTIYSDENKDRKDILDPLPHDSAYFANHLKFAQNYFRKVSYGRKEIKYEVIPEIFTVSQAMREYSPAVRSSELTPLAGFAEEVWELVDASPHNIDFSQYDLFTIFHAGVGRDVSTPGSIGNERDLPSVYLSKSALQSVFGSSFTGFPVNGGAYSITNTMILPETESRELQAIGGTILLELTINGLIAASIASHLGLPDLFNTETGQSAIGRFGLMDGQSIFAYSGLFPPEPSPWEKMYLGWIDPVEAPVVSGSFSVASTKAFGDTVLLKIPLNSNEYYLIENRARDSRNDGIVITYIDQGEQKTITIDKDTTGFRSYGVDTVDGIVIDVDEFDWAVPGNGIVIWHIDESIIAANLESNTINNDKFNRGIDVEEADGIQDIGEEFYTIFGDVVIGEGTDEDFWFDGNPAKLYENEFTPYTKPNTNSNVGGNSLLSFTDFTSASNKMSFNLSFASGDIELLNTVNLPLVGTGRISVTNSEDDKFTTILEGNNLIILNNSLSTIASLKDFSNYKPLSIKLSDKTFFIGIANTQLNILWIESGGSISIDSINIFTDSVSTYPVIFSSDANSFSILSASVSGELKKIDVNNSDPSNPVVSDYSGTSGIGNVKQILTDPASGYAAVVSKNKIMDNNGNEIDVLMNIKKAALTKSGSGNNQIVLLGENNRFVVLSGGKVANDFTINSTHILESFTLADIKNDGENYIITSSGKYLYAYNLNGRPAEYFPFEELYSDNFTGTPLAADLNNDNYAEILITTEAGNIYAVDGFTSRLMDGFPISSGRPISATPGLTASNNKLFLTLLDNADNLSKWNLSNNPGKVYWGSEYGSPANNSFVDAALAGNKIDQYFPKDKAYNWPNPVYGNETYIRYYVSEDSKVNIKIFDLAGDYVAELNDNASGGFDNETTWNVSEIESGVYFARLQVNGSSGKQDEKIIKIAVIK